jgi:hypothetical protein
MQQTRRSERLIEISLSPANALRVSSLEVSVPGSKHIARRDFDVRLVVGCRARFSGRASCAVKSRSTAISPEQSRTSNLSSIPGVVASEDTARHAASGPTPLITKIGRREREWWEAWSGISLASLSMVMWLERA